MEYDAPDEMTEHPAAPPMFLTARAWNIPTCGGRSLAVVNRTDTFVWLSRIPCADKLYEPETITQWSANH